MIHIKLFFTFFLISLFSNAQILPDGLQVEVGSEFSTSGKREIKRFVSSSNTNLIAYTRLENELEFLLFDRNMNLLKSNKIELKSGSRNLDFKRVEETTFGIYIFSTYKDEESNLKVLYYQILDPYLLTLSGARVLHSKPYLEQNEIISYYVNVSESKELVMVDVTKKSSDDFQDMGVETFDIIVYNSELERVWREDSIQLSDNDERFFRSERRLTNQGKVIMMGLQLDADLETIEGISSTEDVMQMFKYYVIKIDDNKNHFLFELKLEAGYFANMNYAINPEGNINVIGLAYDKEEDVRSWYFTTIDLDSNSFSVENNSDFNLTKGVLFHREDAQDTELGLVQASPNVSKLSLPLANIEIKKIFSDEMGVTVAFESTVRSGNRYNKSNTIIGAGAVRFSKDGKQLWSQGIQKIQYPSVNGDKYTSVGILSGDGKVSFVFNFNPVNETNGKLDNYAWTSTSSSDLYVATIDNSGDLKINQLLKGSKKPFWVPKVDFRPGNNELIFSGYSGKTFKLARMSIK